MLCPSMWLPREQDSFILCYPIIFWKLLLYVITMIAKFSKWGAFCPPKMQFKLQFWDLCQENVIEKYQENYRKLKLLSYLLAVPTH